MNQKERHKKNEMKYRKTRIDRHNTPVNNFLDEAIANKKSVTRAIHELLDREAHLEAQLRQSEEDKINDMLRLCEVIFKNNLPNYRANQLNIWMTAFKRLFVSKQIEIDGELLEPYNIERAIEAIKDLERDNAYILIKAAKPIIGKE